MFILILFLCLCSPRLCQFISVQVMPMPFFSVHSILSFTVCIFFLSYCMYLHSLSLLSSHLASPHVVTVSVRATYTVCHEFRHRSG